MNMRPPIDEIIAAYHGLDLTSGMNLSQLQNKIAILEDLLQRAIYEAQTYWNLLEYEDEQHQVKPHA